MCRRKNLGYLFAIEHGATTVYETDDDNELKFIRPPTLPSFSSMEYYVYNATGFHVSFIGILHLNVADESWEHSWQNCSDAFS